MQKKNSLDKLYKAFIYAALIALAVSILLPMLWVFMASIKQNSEFYRSPWTLPEGFYFQNFVEAWTKAKMSTYMINSVMVTSMALAMLVAIALPAAYVLARFPFKGRKFLDGLFKAGLFVNVNYIVVPIFLMILDWDGALKGGGSLLLNNRFVLALVYTATALPFTIYLLSNFFRTLPSTFEEAASIDGASYFTTMLRIMAPMAKPSIVTVILFNFLAFWNEYIIALTLVSREAYQTLPVGLKNLMQAQRGASNFGALYAGMVIVMLPTLILYILVQQKLTQGMTLGGSKE